MQRRTKFQILIAYYIVCVVIGIVIAMLGKPICVEDVCVEKSSFVQSKMADGVDPCKDFYKFLCGGAPTFVPEQLRNTTTNMTNIPRESESIYNYMVRKVANYAASAKAGAFSAENTLYHESQISKFFSMCETAEKVYDQATNEDVKIKLQLSLDGTGMSLKHLILDNKFNKSLSSGIYEYRLRMVGFPGRHYFTSMIKTDHVSRDRLALYISRANSFKSVSPVELDKRDKDEWYDVVRALILYFIPSAKKEQISTTLLKKVIDLWFDMRKVLETVEDKKVKVQAVEIKEMQKWFPDLDFDGVLKTVGADEKSRHHVYIQSNSHNYFSELKKVLIKYSRQEKVVYQFWQSILDVTPFLSFDSLVSSMLEGIETLNMQSELCQGMLGNRFGGMVLSLIIERFELQRKPPEAISTITVNFEDVMRGSLLNTPWMDPTTKKSGLAKLKAMRTQISLSKKQYDSINTPGKRARYYNGLCYQRSILTTLMCANRFFAQKNYGLFKRDITGFDEADEISMGGIEYNQEINEFQVPIFILRFPAFDNSWPYHINLGAMGVEVAAELMKGFDLEGSNRDKFGIENQWWTNNTIERYKKKEFECSKMMQPLDNKTVAHSRVTDPARLTMEDLNKGELRRAYWRNLMGVKMSLKVYKDFISKQTPKQQFLPGLEGYTTMQNFFFSHAHMRCLHPMAPEELKRNTRIYFEALSSQKEFKDAFGCPSKPRNRMSAIIGKASKKCILFQ